MFTLTWFIIKLQQLVLCYVILLRVCSMDFLADIWNFLKERKKWWLLPMILVLLLIGTLVVLAGSSAIAPFIYTLF